MLRLKVEKDDMEHLQDLFAFGHFQLDSKITSLEDTYTKIRKKLDQKGFFHKICVGLVGHGNTDRILPSLLSCVLALNNTVQFEWFSWIGSMAAFVSQQGSTTVETFCGTTGG
jgi:hypothetical protein